MEKNKRQIINYQIFDSPIGKLYIAEDGMGICRVMNIGTIRNDDPVRPKASPLLSEAVSQLTQYFAGERREFDLPLSLYGTEFQQKVWNALLEIPYGETDTYGGIAQKIGNPKACRAVGMANNKNPIMIIVPCHRVIGANGSLVGYGGGLDMKQYLLDLEKGK